MLLPFVIDIQERTRENNLIASYYERLHFENVAQNEYRKLHDSLVQDGTLKKQSYFISSKAIRVASCGKSIAHELYQNQGIKDLQSINFCGNRFCQLCASQKALTRFLRNKPILDAAAAEYGLYHIALTVPNCPGGELADVDALMFKAFYYLNRYLACTKKIKGIDFRKYGYAGAFRALEITHKFRLRSKGQEYHPHLHGILALKKDLHLEKTEFNMFSRSYKSDRTKLYSELEILVQKIWFLLMTRQRVNFKNIDAIPEGYSCSIDEIDNGSYYEVFKYAIKVYSEGDEKEVLRYEQLKTLDAVLHGKRCVQGYGCFYNIKCDDEIDESFIAVRDIIRAHLRQFEEPVLMASHINQVFEDMCQDAPEFTYLNMKAIHNLDLETIEAIKAEPDSQERLKAALKRLQVKREAQKIDKRERELDHIRARLWGCVFEDENGGTYIDQAKFERMKSEMQRRKERGEFATQQHIKM